ncbi:hypothetical protein MY11210_008751 [Beauveria gryllotalpidicola]
MPPQPQFPPLPPTQITINQISESIRTWAALFVESHGYCICGQYTFHGICGHIVHDEILLCGATATPAGMVRSCHLLTPEYICHGYVIRMICETCYDDG